MCGCCARVYVCTVVRIGVCVLYGCLCGNGEEQSWIWRPEDKIHYYYYCLSLSLHAKALVLSLSFFFSPRPFQRHKIAIKNKELRLWYDIFKANQSSLRVVDRKNPLVETLGAYGSQYSFW